MKSHLIILHGALGAREQFSGWAKALSEYFTCHLLDFAGHGSRAAEACDFTIAGFADDLQDYIIKSQLEKPRVLGYSMGGYVALYAALQNPGLLSDIMTVATKFDWNPESSKREAGYLRPEVMWQKVPQFAEQLRARHGLHWEEVVAKTARMMLALGEAPPLSAQNIGQVVNRIKFCVGDKDKMVSIHETHAMYKAAAHASMSVLPDTGHLPESMRTAKITFEAKEFFLQGPQE
jgi:pimeloyl-ACP methyl ester carboxylesterase